MKITEQQIMIAAKTIADEKYDYELDIGVFDEESWLFFKLAELQLRIEALEDKKITERYDKW